MNIYKWINDDEGMGAKIDRLLLIKGYVTYRDLEEIMNGGQIVKTKYQIGFSFNFNLKPARVVPININRKGQILYKCETFLKDSKFMIVVNQAQLDNIVSGELS